MSSNNLKKKALGGFSWNLFGNLTLQFVRFVTGIILARILGPQAFGLIGMIMAFTGFATIFSNLGFSSALIQLQDVKDEHYSSVFWVNVVAGLLLTVLFVACAPLISAFYDKPVLEPLIRFMALSFFIGSLIIVQKAYLEKNFLFDVLVKVEIAATIISSVLAIILAVIGFGIWSLAAKFVALPLVVSLLIWYFSPWKPSFNFSYSKLKGLLSFSTYQLSSRSLNYWVRNLDNLLIGKCIGSSALGLYTKSYSLMLLPMTQLTTVISRVLFPTLSSLKQDKAKTKRVYLLVVRVISVISFPLMIGLCATADNFVISVFGWQWIDMIPLVRILSLVGLWQSIGTLVGQIYLSQGRADLQFKVGVPLKIFVIASIIIGLNWGVLGVVIAYSISTTINSYPVFYYAGKLINLKYSELLTNVNRAFGSSCLMGIIVYGVGYLNVYISSHFVVLIIQVVTGIIIYWSIMHYGEVTSYLEAKEILNERISLFKKKFFNRSV